MQTIEAFSPDSAVTHIAHQLRPRGPGALRPTAPPDMGLLATLRRFHPLTHGQHCVFETERVLHAAGVHPGSATEQLRWAVIVHCLALARGAISSRSPGEALAALRFSEPRLRQLLQADADLLLQLMPSLARRLHAAGQALDWWPLAKLVLNAGLNEPAADEARAWIARGFIQAAGREGNNDTVATHKTNTTGTGSPT